MNPQEISTSMVSSALYKRRGLRPIDRAPPTQFIKNPVVPEFNTTFTSRVGVFFGHLWGLIYWMSVFIKRYTSFLKPMDEQEPQFPNNTNDEYNTEDNLENDPEYLPETFSYEPLVHNSEDMSDDDECVFFSEKCPDDPTKRIRPDTHPVIYGMGIEYRSMMSSHEKKEQIKCAFNQDSIPNNNDDAWDFFKNNYELAEKYRVQNYC